MDFKGRRVLAALVAVFALGAVASASALAAPPEFTLKTGEKFPDAITAPKESVSAGFETVLANPVCSTNAASGEITAAKAMSLTLEWKGCKSVSTGEAYTSEGAPENGEILIPGSGSLVFMNEKREIGILFALKETKIVEAGLKMTLKGSVLIHITPINTETSKFNLAIDKTSTTGVPKYTRYENEQGEVKEAYLQVVIAGKSEGTAMYVGVSSNATFPATVHNALTVATTTPPPAYLSSFGSAGTEGGKFSDPQEAAVASNGNVFVADTGNNRIQEFTSSGAFVEAFGWGVSNGKAEFQICTSKCQAGIAGSGNGQFNVPDGIAVTAGATGPIYVSDGANERVEKFSATGEYLSKFGGEGSEGGKFGHKSVWGWEGPKGIAVPNSTHIYVTDNNSVQEFTNGGERFSAQWALEGSPNGVAATGEDVYIAEEGLARVQELTSLDEPIVTWGSQGTGNGQFRCPHGVAVGPSGEVFVADECNDRIQEFGPLGGYATQWGSAGTKEGQFSSPSGVAVAPNGNVYVVDQDNDRVQKFE